MRCMSGVGDCNGGWMNGKPFRCSKCRLMPDGSTEPPVLCAECRVMHAPQASCPTDDEAGAIAIMALQKKVGIEEPKEEALAGWARMTASEREKTLMAYRIVVAPAA